MESVTLTLFKYGPWTARLWAFAQMGFARLPLNRVAGLQSWKLCGAGTGEGFTPIPNTAVNAILATWSDHETARRAIFGASPFRQFKDRAEESCTIFLSPTSVRGTWAGETPFRAKDAPGGPIAALTRATIKPKVALKFWGRVPNISAVIGEDPNVLFKIGIGEVPWLHQVTFSIWPSTETMAAFARHDGPHARAIHAVRTEGWFKEELYARFRVDAVEGSWPGLLPTFSERSSRPERMAAE